ncbi:Molybdopterin synthase catalytic subunit [Sulfobacillus acidophilus TPY]|uniref:Molybdopterin synthase subunit MoaE n=1 Tax=Sulfobacillus acidophilus (strain ATCC 700253 / DSM 10332 / NAL) TaxID=679936 RepID=G8U0J3_SULAD|nr:Molybdopterin synthase catalytic subunit [Sulfobacillus acidophilus TPY]AEW04215.1 molybdopterin synthase subunit MoaE [Sulfobacillus acidophilus DSM 10332]
MDIYRITTEPIVIQEALDAIQDPACGGQAIFLGTVRNEYEGRPSHGLIYDAYRPLAEKEMARIGDELRRRHDIRHIVMIHRIGHLAVTDMAVVVAVSAAHREAAMAAAREGIDEIKRRAPIWKKELFDDGDEAWHHDPDHFPSNEETV